VPIRLLREGILSSDRVETLDAPAEVFYRRLMSKVDDYGLFDARPAMLRSSLYPLRVDRVREADITRWIAACEKAGLIALYSHDGKPFMQMLDTGWQTRSEPKFPLPPWGKAEPPRAIASNCLQPQATAPVFGVVVGVEDEGGDGAKRAPKPRKKAIKVPMPEGFDAAPSQSVMRWAAEKGFDRISEHLEAFARKSRAKAYEYADWDLAFMEAIREDWAKLRGRGVNGAAPPSEAAGPSHTVDSKAADHTQAYLRSQQMTPEQEAAAAAARKAFLEKHSGKAAAGANA
jgi:hypothetical protein